MIKRANTPANPPRAEPQKEGPRRIFGKDLKNIITNYHNKFSEATKSSTRLSVELQGEGKGKCSVRNNSQKILKREMVRDAVREDGRKLEAKKSMTESTEASPKAVTIKDYLKSKAPKAISEISSDLPINS